MKLNELRNKTTDDLKKLEEVSRAELFALRFKSSIGSLDKPHLIKVARRKIAIILTILSERKSDGENINIQIKKDLLKSDRKETITKLNKDIKEFTKKQQEEINKISNQNQNTEESLDPTSSLANMALGSELEDDLDQNLDDVISASTEPVKEDQGEQDANK